MSVTNADDTNDSPNPKVSNKVGLLTNGIEKIIAPKEKDLGGFSVRRVLPSMKQRLVGPWIFFDHMGPATFAPGEGIDVRPHPHINLATVTYLFEGQIFHRDSLGNAQAIEPGDINLMVAGHGIVHSERTSAELRKAGQRVHGLQLWLALPEAQEEIDPEFHHYPGDSMPKDELDGVTVRVMMGTAYGMTSPVKTFAETLYMEADLKKGQTLLLPFADERAVYVASGEVRIGDVVIKAHTMAVIVKQHTTSVIADEDARIAVIGGESMSPRHIEWNFVSSRPERIEQAKERWSAGQFPTVPGDEKEFIPLPT